MIDIGDLVELLGSIATEDPDRVFLEESKTSTLSYGHSYRLVTNLLPSQLCSACPQLTTPAQPQKRVVLISHNNTLFPLILWACWYLSLEVVPLSVSMDSSLWEASINLLKPCIILASHSTRPALAEKTLKATDCPVMMIDDLIPKPYRTMDSLSRKSDYIPSLLRWKQMNLRSLTSISSFLRERLNVLLSHYLPAPQ